MFEKTFGETIRKLRDEKQLALREVAEELEISTSMLGKIEKNSRKPNHLLIKKISYFFKVSERNLLVAFLSDEIAQQLLYKEDYVNEVFKVAEEKVKYLKAKNL